MDLFSTNRLLGVVQDLRALPPSGPSLLSLLFPTIVEEASEEVHVDREDGPRRLAPFVSPIMAGKIVESLGFTTSTIRPAYVKDKRVFQPQRALKRTIGEPLMGSLSPEARIARLLARDLADQLAMLRRRKELMAAEVLRTGKLTITGDGFNAINVDFLRAAGLTKTLAGAARWNQAGVSPVADVETWGYEMAKTSNAIPTEIFFELSAWQLFKADAKFEKAVDLLRGGDAKVDVSPRIATGPVLRGTMGTFRLWTYQDWYVDSAGTEQQMFPQYTVVMAGGAVEGVQLHGAIQDEEAGLVATEFFPKTWIEKDPSQRILLGQSAPLVAPLRPNATLGATVV